MFGQGLSDHIKELTEQNLVFINWLKEVVTNGEWTDGEQRGQWKISKEVYDSVKEVVDRYT